MTRAGRADAARLRRAAPAGARLYEGRALLAHAAGNSARQRGLSALADADVAWQDRGISSAIAASADAPHPRRSRARTAAREARRRRDAGHLGGRRRGQRRARRRAARSRSSSDAAGRGGCAQGAVDRAALLRRAELRGDGAGAADLHDHPGARADAGQGLAVPGDLAHRRCAEGAPNRGSRQAHECTTTSNGCTSRRCSRRRWSGHPRIAIASSTPRQARPTMCARKSQSLLYAHAQESGQLEAAVRAAAGAAIARSRPARVRQRAHRAVPLCAGSARAAWARSTSPSAPTRSSASRSRSSSSTATWSTRRSSGAFAPSARSSPTWSTPTSRICSTAARRADGLPYLVMEYVVGRAYRRLLRRARAVAARAAAHCSSPCATPCSTRTSNLVVHRDIKPSNILVTADGRAEAAGFRHRQAGGRRRPNAARALHPRRRTADDARARESRAGTRRDRDDGQRRVCARHPALSIAYRTAPIHARGRQHTALERAICETVPDKPSTVVKRAAAGDSCARRRRQVRHWRRDDWRAHSPATSTTSC